MLKGKKILVGITASISAYKINYLVRLLVKAQADVKVMVSPAAEEVVSALTLSTLSGNPVLSSFTSESSHGVWNNHVALGEWADLLVIAPASANSMAKMAHGFCDNLLLAVYLSAKCPVWFAPAMDLDMYKHGSTKNNISILVGRGDVLIPPGTGALASGLSGEGRLEEPEHIYELISSYFNKKNDLEGLKAFVTAGPTHEYMGPVRFIGNPSSGKMGVYLADALAAHGAEVTLVCGPSAVGSTHPSVRRVDVISAKEMFEEAKPHAMVSDISCMAAAVADYTPVDTFEHKVKKKEGSLSIMLKRTDDVLKYFGTCKSEHQVLVGFAMETENEVENASVKLSNKNADLIVLNSLNDPSAGFQHETNKVVFVSNDTKPRVFELKSKRMVCSDVVQEIIRIRNKKKTKEG